MDRVFTSNKLLAALTDESVPEVTTRVSADIYNYRRVFLTSRRDHILQLLRVNYWTTVSAFNKLITAKPDPLKFLSKVNNIALSDNVQQRTSKTICNYLIELHVILKHIVINEARAENYIEYVDIIRTV